MENEVSGSARNILRRYLEELGAKELKTFTFLLEDYPVVKGYSKIPRGQLENADSLKIAGLMIDYYHDEHALDITGNILCKIPRRDLYDTFKSDSQKLMAKNPKPHETRVTRSKEIYMERMKEKFTSVEDHNRRPGEYISLKKRYTRLVIVKEYRPKAERVREIKSSGREHLALMAQRAGRSYSSAAALFDPEEDGHVPRTVMLQGAAGIGKTITARKMMLDWASGELFQGRFDYVFYIHCREVKQCGVQQTIAELLSHSCPGMSPPMSQIEAEAGKCSSSSMDLMN